jgi:hypothetical protein
LYVINKKVAFMADFHNYLMYGSMLAVSLILGRWYSKERDALMAKGEPWIKSWQTIPGILILAILFALIAAKVWLERN